MQRQVRISMLKDLRLVKLMCIKLKNLKYFCLELNFSSILLEQVIFVHVQYHVANVIKRMHAEWQY